MTRGKICRPWSAADEEALRRIFADLPTADVARELGRTVNAVRNRAGALGLRKSAAFRAGPGAGTFLKGQVPWNKGVPGSTGVHPNCRNTYFKAGRPAEWARNYKPIGSLRLNADGSLERKVTDDRAVVPARRWVPVHRLVWLAANGPLGPGEIVVFKPGQKTAVLELITPDRLEKITRAENARRNHPKNRHPEYAKLVQLRGAITRQVNRIFKNAQEGERA